MGSKYLTQTQTGYNQVPPSDDGSMTAQNTVTWAGIKTKLGDPTLILAQAINTALVTALNFSGRSISGNDTSTAADHMWTIECTTTLTATLVDTSVGAGFIISYINTGTGTVTINLANPANTLDGTVNGTATLLPNGWASFKVNSAGTGYIANGISSYYSWYSPNFTGIPTAPTATFGTSTTQVATTAFAANLAFSTALPAQTGNNGKIVTTNGTTASWSLIGTAGQLIGVNAAGTAIVGVMPSAAAVQMNYSLYGGL